MNEKEKECLTNPALPHASTKIDLISLVRHLQVELRNAKTVDWNEIEKDKKKIYELTHELNVQRNMNISLRFRNTQLQKKCDRLTKKLVKE